jgi:hypothetical protein
MSIKRLYDGDALCAIHVTNDEWKDGLNFFSQDADFIQAGTWQYPQGKELATHQHLPAERIAGWTQEVVYVKSGRLKATVYGLQQQKLGEFEASPGDILIMLQGGHGYSILEDGTQILEVKNGPYPGAERDRFRFGTKK